MKDDCVFCKIIRKEIPSEIVYEMTNVVAFEDKEPSSDTHILVVPKKHISNLLDIKKEDNRIIEQMLRLVKRIIEEKKLEDKYKVVINGGEYQFVPHLHMHVLGGEMKKEGDITKLC